jgi:predicted histidine transporter YuiF (NhaC family)
MSGRYDFDEEPRRSATPAVLAIISGVVMVSALIAMLAVISRRTEQAKQRVRHGPVESRQVESRQAADGSLDDSPMGATATFIVGFVALAVVIAMAALYILMLVYVVRDCRNRSVDGGIFWMLVVGATHFVGLLVYLASRPAGALLPCRHCGNPRLDYVSVCPHCRRASP